MSVILKPFNQAADWRDPYGQPVAITHIVVARGLEDGKPLELHVLCKKEDVERQLEQCVLYPGWVTCAYTVQEYLEQSLGYFVVVYD